MEEKCNCDEWVQSWKYKIDFIKVYTETVFKKEGEAIEFIKEISSLPKEEQRKKIEEKNNSVPTKLIPEPIAVLVCAGCNQEIEDKSYESCSDWGLEDIRKDLGHYMSLYVESERKRNLTEKELKDLEYLEVTGQTEDINNKIEALK